MLKKNDPKGVAAALILSLFMIASVSAQTKQPTQQEVADYIKLLDAKITFNRAQGNTAKVKELQAEKQRTLNRWKTIQQGGKAPAAAPAAKTPAAPLPSTQAEVRARLQTLDSQIASARAQGNSARVKALRAEKQRVVRHWQNIQRNQAQQAKAAPKGKAAVQLSELEGPVDTWLNNGHTAFRVLKAEKKNSDPRGGMPPAGTIFYVVTVEIKNKDPFTAVYGGDYHRVMVIDANRVYYMENIAKNPVNWADNDDIKELMPAETFQTAYVFVMPEEAVPDKLIFDVSSADKYPVMRVSLR